MNQKLDEIRENLTNLKNFGLNSSSQDYYKYVLNFIFN